MLVKTSLAGNSCKTQFITSKPIKLIELYGVYRLSIRLIYIDNTSDSFGDLMRFRGSISIVLDSLTQVDYSAEKFIDYLCFRTSNGKVIKAGEPGLDIKSFDVPKNSTIKGFFGSFGSFLYGFGLLYEENPFLKDLSQIEIEEVEASLDEKSNDKNQKASILEENKDKNNNQLDILEEDNNKFIENKKIELPQSINKVEYNKKEDFLEKMPENIKIFILIKPLKSELAERFYHFLSEASQNRFICLPNHRYPPIYIMEGINQYITKFQMTSDVSHSNEISIILIELPNDFPMEKFLQSPKVCIVLFSIDPKTSFRDFQKDREKKLFKTEWKIFVLKIISFLKLCLNEEKIPPSLIFLSVEELAKLKEKELLKYFESILLKTFNPITNIDRITMQLEKFKDIEYQKNYIEIEKKDLNSNFDNTYSSWAKQFCFQACKDLADSRSLPLHEKHKIRSYYISHLYTEINLMIEQKNALTSVLLRHKMANNKNFAVNLCIFLLSYLDEIESKISEPLKQNSEIIEEEEKFPDQALIQKIMDETSYLNMDFFKDSCFLNCYRLIEILCKCATNENLSSELIDKNEFMSLCSALLLSNNAFFNLQGQWLFFKALNQNPQLYRSKLANDEQKKGLKQSYIGSLVINNMIKLVSPLFELPLIGSLAQKYLLLLEKYHVFEVKSLFESNFFHSSSIKPSHISQIFDLIQLLFEGMQEFENTTSLLGLLTILLKFSDQSVIEKILQHYKILLSISSQCINFFINSEMYEIQFKSSLELYNTILFALSRFEFYLLNNKRKRTEEFNDEFFDEKNYVFKEENPKKNKDSFKKEKPQKKQKTKKELKKEKRLELKLSKTNKEKKSEQKDASPAFSIENKPLMMLDIVMKLKKNSQPNYLIPNSSSFNQDKLKFFLQQNSQEIKNLSKENKSLNILVEKQKKEFNDLMNNNRAIEQEKLDLKESYSRLLIESSKEKFKHYNLNPIDNPENNEMPIFDEDNDDFLKISLFGMISESQAQIFLENLQKTRKNMKELRSSICGALKFLSDDLYSSSIHFFYEIIQNAEDNQYSSESSPFLDFFLGEKSIIVANNEMGFLPKNVAAICQIGQSSKQAGISIGQKGLGFKSVFSCSNNPKILSYPWKFEFRVQEGVDELQYITPYWIEDFTKEFNDEIESLHQCKTNKEYTINQKDFLKKTNIKDSIINEEYQEPLKLDNYKFSNEGQIIDPNPKSNFIENKVFTNFNPLCQTMIYLPFKEQISIDRRNNMLDEILESLDENILLNLTNLQTINVFDRRNNSNSLIFKQMKSEIAIGTQVLSEKTFFNITKREILLKKTKTVNLKTFSTSSELLVYTCELLMPNSALNEEKTFRANKRAKILLAFPRKDLNENHYPIYAFLPILKESHGFKFIINCDWTLTTNRESLRENEWNAFIRNSLVNLFIWLVFSDEHIKINFSYFLPKEIQSLWWRRFAHDIHEELNKKENILRLFNFEKNKDFYLSNEQIRLLIPFEEMKEYLPNIYILDLKEIKLNEEFFQKSCKKLSSEQILDCLECEVFYSRKKCLKNTANKKWWKDLYKLIIQELFIEKDQEFIIKESNVLEKLAKAPIFLNSGSRVKVPFKNNLNIFICDNIERWISFDWREEIYFLEYDSDIEYKFLHKCLQFQEISVEALLKHIYSFHCNYSHINSQKNLFIPKDINSILWKDMRFIQQNFELFRKLFPFEIFELKIPLLDKKGIGRVIDSIFPFILGVNIETNNNESFDKYQIIDINCNGLNEILEWELFFMKIGCQSIKKEEISHILFHNFNSLSIQSIELLLRIIDLRPNITFLLKEMKILCNDNKLYAINEVFDFDLINDEEFPSIKIPNNCNELAEKIGIKMKSTLFLSLKVLSNLVKRKEKSFEKFQKWLFQLNSNINELKILDSFDENEMSSLEILYFPSNELKPYCSVKEILISDEKDEDLLNFISKVCQKTEKFLISIKHNIEYLPFLFLLKKLGASSNFDLPLLNSFFESLINDPLLYYEKGNKMSLLNEQAWSLYQNSFQYYEKLLQKELFPKYSSSNENPTNNDWSFKRNLKDIIKTFKSAHPEFRTTIPFITHLRTILSPFTALHKMKFVCLNSEITNIIAHDSEDYVFFEPDLAFKCPIIIALLEIPYLELSSKIHFFLVPKNPMRVLVELSKSIVKTFNLNKELNIVKAIFAALTLQINSDSVNYDKASITKFKLMMRSPFICTPDLIYLNDPNPRFLNTNLALKAISNYLKDFQTNTFDEKEIIRVIKETNEKEEVFWKERQYNTEKVRFPGKETELLDENTEIFQDQTKEIYVSSDQQPLHNFFMQKFQSSKLSEKAYTLQSIPFFPTTPMEIQKETQAKESITKIEKPIGPFIVNNLEMQNIGSNAEFFFYTYLSYIYQNNCKPQNWISSSRMIRFPMTRDNSVNDAAGFDFEILDTLQIFKPYYNNKPIKMLFEVKGFKSIWNKTFIMSQNEIDTANEIFYDPYVSYNVVIIENAGNGEIRIVAVLDWKETSKFMKLTSESSKIELNQNLYEESLKTKEEKRPEQGRKECSYRYFCQKGGVCKFWHSEREMNFFYYNGINGSYTISNRDFKKRKCVINHRSNEEMNGCIYSHDQYDSYCMMCAGWVGHLKEDCMKMGRVNNKIRKY